MRTHLLRLGRHALVYGMSGAAVQLVGLVTLPVFARAFSPAEYGVIEIATVSFAALIVLVDGGLGAALHRDWFEIPDDRPDERRTVASTATLSSVALACVIALALILAAEPLASWLLGDPGRSDVIVLVALSAPAGTLAVFFRDIMRVRFRPGHFAVSATLAALTAAVVAVVWVVWFDGGVESVVAGLLAGQVLAAAYGWVIVRGDLVLRVSRRRLRSLLSFGLPLIPAAAATWAIAFADRILLSKLDTLAATGEYAVASRFSAVLMFFVGALATAYTPFLFSLHASNPEREGAVRAALLVYASAGFVAVALGLTLFAREIAAVLAPGYDRAYEVVGVLCLAVAAFGLAPVAGAGINLTRQTRFAARYSIVAMIANIALCFALIPPLGLLGAALATAAAYALMIVLYFHRSQQLSPAPFRFGTAVAVFMTGAVLAPVGLLELDSEVLTLVVKALALAAFAVALVPLGVVGTDERAELRRALARLRSGTATA